LSGSLGQKPADINLS